MSSVSSAVPRSASLPEPKGFDAFLAIALVAVIGVPHPVHGEEIKAVVVLRQGQSLAPDELIDWCRERMAAYKYPRIVEIVDALPMTATGKILKRALRAS